MDESWGAQGSPFPWAPWKVNSQLEVPAFTIISATWEPEAGGCEFEASLGTQ